MVWGGGACANANRHVAGNSIHIVALSANCLCGGGGANTCIIACINAKRGHTMWLHVTVVRCTFPCGMFGAVFVNVGTRCCGAVDRIG